MSSDRTLPQSGNQLRRAQEQSRQPLRPPTTLPGYEPERFLGSGAYGEVWVALDRNTGRRVAIKFYTHRGGLDWSLLSREVEKLAFLFADRYVVQLVDVGWDADPPYYVMEYLEQGSLEDRLQEGPLSVPEAVALARDVAIGLVHAHGKGVLHCDLKPANVLLDQDFKPRLADFGQSRLTTEQMPALGTLFYMAPEQADLAAVPDARWDVYALGSLLYSMLTGQPPYRTPELVAEIEEAGSLRERLERYRRGIERGPRPTAHRQVRGIDRALAEIIDRCLEVEPRRRYPNAQAVLDALDERARQRARRPLLVLGALGPMLLLLIMTAFAWNVVQTAVDDSGGAVTRRALESNRFAAQFVAETVASQIDRRWQTLEQEAADPSFRALLEQADADRLGEGLQRLRETMLDEKEARGLDLAAFEQAFREALDGAGPGELAVRLQEHMERLQKRYPGLETTSWFITDKRGVQLARSPFDGETVGDRYDYRDYFHGQGKEYPPGTAGLEPIQGVHRSIVFESRATKNRMVAFSVPVWSAEEEPAEREVLGVLAMTVELGHFAELRRSARDQVAVLVDSLPDGQGKRGSILEHPRLAELSRQAGHVRLPGYHLEEHVGLLEALRHERRRGGDALEPGDEPGLLADYHDPVGGAYTDRWLAALEPVFVAGRALDEEGRQRDDLDTGWVVIVQERYDAATAPVQQLGDRLVRQGILALSVVIAVVTALWGFVIVVLTESSRHHFVGSLRRSVGLGTPIERTTTWKPESEQPTGELAGGPAAAGGGEG